MDLSTRRHGAGRRTWIALLALCRADSGRGARGVRGVHRATGGRRGQPVRTGLGHRRLARRPHRGVSLRAQPGVLSGDDRLRRAVPVGHERLEPHAHREWRSGDGGDQPAGDGRLGAIRHGAGEREAKPGNRDLRTGPRRRGWPDAVLDSLPPTRFSDLPGKPGGAGLAGVDPWLLLHREHLERQRDVLRHGARRQWGPGLVPAGRRPQRRGGQRPAAPERRDRLDGQSHHLWHRPPAHRRPLLGVQPRYAVALLPSGRRAPDG